MKGVKRKSVSLVLGDRNVVYESGAGVAFHISVSGIGVVSFSTAERTALCLS